MTQIPDAVTSPEEIGALLRARREAAGLTQSEVAKMIGVHRRYVYAIESGHGGLYVQRVTSLLTLLGVTLRPEIDGVPAGARRKARAAAAVATVEPDVTSQLDEDVQRAPRGLFRRLRREG